MTGSKFKESEYSKKLRDPRWQKMRLRIMERDEFTCQKCLDSENTLNVHHCYYEKCKEPWDYPESSLITLCESCHKDETEWAYQEKKMLGDALSCIGFLSSHFNDIGSTVYEGMIRGSVSFANGTDRDVFVSALGWAICQGDMRALIRDKYHEYLAERCKRFEAKRLAKGAAA